MFIVAKENPQPPTLNDSPVTKNSFLSQHNFRQEVCPPLNHPNLRSGPILVVLIHSLSFCLARRNVITKRNQNWAWFQVKIIHDHLHITNKEDPAWWRKLEQDDTSKIKTGHAMLCLNVIILNWLLNLNNGHFINSNCCNYNFFGNNQWLNTCYCDRTSRLGLLTWCH